MKKLIYFTLLLFACTISQAQSSKSSFKLGQGFIEVDPSLSEIHVQFFISKGSNMELVLNQLTSLYNFRTTLSIPSDQYAEGYLQRHYVEDVASMNEIQAIDAIVQGTPEAIHDRQAAVRSNWLNSSVTGLSFDGTGMTIALRESGSVTDDDINFAGRQKDAFESGAIADHKDGVAAHMAGAGNVNPRHIGVAPGADFYDLPISGINFNNLYNDQNVKYVNRSSGLTIGSAIYNIDSKNRDQNVYNNPELLFVYSAGNSNGNTGNYNHGIYSSLQGTEYGTITLDEKISKNNIVAQSVTQYDGGYGLGSRGPTYDGRIKPDLSADGELGTSHSAPKITGVLALLNQAYQHHYGVHPQSALLKAILFNTADDHGRKGPDFRYGYGKMNSRRAYNCLKDGRFFTDTIMQGEQVSYQIQLPSDASDAVEFKVTLTWCDPAVANVVPTPDTALVNNLDLSLEVNGTTILPWVLNTFPHEDSLKLEATRGVDYLNNTEQITFNIPAEYLGKTVTLKVNGSKLDTAYPQQNFFLAYEIVKKELVLTTPLGNEKWKPLDEQIIRWDAYGITSDFRIEYREAGTSDWTTLTHIPNDKRHYRWDIPDVSHFYFKSYEFQIVTISDTMSYQSQAVHFAPVPTGLEYVYSCDDVHYFTWDLIDTSEVTYHMHYLDGKYMVKQEIDFTDTLAFCDGPHPHFAISATRNGISSRRSLAISPTQDSTHCVITGLDHGVKPEFKLYPNPARDEVNLSLANAEGEAFTIQLLSFDGRELYSNVTTSALLSINTTPYPPGVYLMVVVGNSERVVKKLVLK